MIAARLLVFAESGEGDQIAQGVVLVDVTDVRAVDGVVEIAWTHNKRRNYLRLSLPDLTRLALAGGSDRAERIAEKSA